MMKNHIEVTRDLYDLDGPMEEVFDRIREEAKGLLLPRLHLEYGWDESQLQVKGFRPMTDAEKEKAKARRKREKEARARLAETEAALARAEYEKLKARFEGGE